MQTNTTTSLEVQHQALQLWLPVKCSVAAYETISEDKWCDSPSVSNYAGNVFLTPNSSLQSNIALCAPNIPLGPRNEICLKALNGLLNILEP